MDATDMREFADNSFDGINASSLVHEIFSYADRFRGVSKFVSEVNRVLIPEGTLFYRDPELNDSLVYTQAVLQDPNLKAFSFFYLANALVDKNNVNTDVYSAKSGLDELYNVEAIHMSYYDKSAGRRIVADTNDLSGIMMQEIDFDQEVALYAEHGVVKELMRHFLTFHQSSPYGTVYFTPEADKSMEVHYASSNTIDRWRAFLLRKEIEMMDDKILLLDSYVRAKDAMREVFDFMQGEVELALSDPQATILRKYVEVETIRFDNSDDEEKLYVVDSLQLSLHYEMLLQYGAINEISFVNPTAFHFFQYLKQEARETYFYLTPDELIAFVAEISWRDNNGYVLVPGEAESSNRTIDRPEYDKFLRHSLSVRSLDDSVSNINLMPSEKKRLIQFTKKSYDQALKALDSLINKNDSSYPMTRQVYEAISKDV